MESQTPTTSVEHDLARKVQQLERQLSEAHQREAATADVLKVISRSALDVQCVLDTIVETACRLCDAHDALALLRNGEMLNDAAHCGPIPTGFSPWPINRDWTAGRAIVDRKPIHVHDMAAAGDEFPDGLTMAIQLGHRTILSIPLLRGNEAIGVLVIRRTEVRPFSEKQIALLRTFADQAVIAIENTRLFEEVQARTEELQESLDRQTATSEVLGVISRSPNEVQPVLDTIVATAQRLCQAERAVVWRLAGETFRAVAHHGPPDERLA